MQIGIIRVYRHYNSTLILGFKKLKFTPKVWKTEPDKLQNFANNILWCETKHNQQEMPHVTADKNIMFHKYSTVPKVHCYAKFSHINMPTCQVKKNRCFWANRYFTIIIECNKKHWWLSIIWEYIYYGIDKNACIKIVISTF